LESEKARKMDVEKPRKVTVEIRNDMDAHDYVMGLPIAQVVSVLVDILGATMVAVIGGVAETRAVQQWIAGREPQRAHTLRFALQIAVMLSSFSDREFAVAWFHGSNPRLGDRAPMFLLRDHQLEDVQGPISDAAREFAKRL
jgi:hypothetical protein